MFARWCDIKRIPAFPAGPGAIAKFLEECASIGADTLWSEVKALSDLHTSRGLADPTRGGVVALAMTKIAGLKPPRSWPKEAWPMFTELPYDVQKFLIRNDRERSAALRVAQEAAAKACRSAGIPKPTRKDYREAAKQAPL